MAKNTSFSLGPHFDKFIEKQLKSGRYSSASEVVRESLRLMEEQEKNKTALRKAIVAGEKSGIAYGRDRGRKTEYRRQSTEDRGQMTHEYFVLCFTVV